MPSARRNTQLAVLVLGGTLAAGSLAGCATTQEKAAAQRAESARILKARENRQEARKNGKDNADGTKSASPKRKSSRQREGER